jgi:ACS family hexuronate transporter-like MFS transporter
MARSASSEPWDRTPDGAEQGLRWFIVAWITLSTILNLIDRQTLSILAAEDVFRKEFGLTNRGYANIVNAFLVSYTVMYTVAGRFVDRVGEKIGMTACILWWSIATMLHSVARGPWSLGTFRFLLGIGEPGNYPAALRVCTTWFARHERGLPIAIFSSGSSVGSLLAVPLISFLTLSFGWRSAFLVPGLLGVIWVLVWARFYRMPGAFSPVPDLPDRSAPVPESMRELLADPNVRAIVLARFVSDPVWTFCLYWVPKYLAHSWGYDLARIGFFGWIPFLFGGMGGVLGGMASDRLIRLGKSPAEARKLVLYMAGGAAPLVMMTGFVPSEGLALALVALTAFVSYVWFINTAALISDVFPERVVGSVLGLMGTAGSLGGIGLNWLAGTLLDRFGSYTSVFIVVGSGHLIASLILYFFMKDAGKPRHLHFDEEGLI